MLLELAALPCEACLFGFLLFDWFTVLGTLETWYSCCKGVLGSPGCQVAKVGFFSPKMLLISNPGLLLSPTQTLRIIKHLKELIS